MKVKKRGNLAKGLLYLTFFIFFGQRGLGPGFQTEGLRGF